jgi:hypothetical protein
MSKPSGGAKRPDTLAERVERAKAKAMKAGARRTPSGMLRPQAAEALAKLRSIEYAPSETGCIEAALIEAAARR